MSFALRLRAIARRMLFALRRTGAWEALVTAKPLTRLSADGARGKRRQLSGAIGLEEGLAEESEGFEPRQNLSQLRFGFHAAQDQMRVVLRGRKRACNFDARVAGLNDLLRKR